MLKSVGASAHPYPQLLQRAEAGVEAVLRQAAGQQVDPRLLWSLSVHLFRIHIQVLQNQTRGLENKAETPPNRFDLKGKRPARSR